MNDLSGTQLKGYQITRRIGLGGTSTVYLAHQDVLEREVAIKAILADYVNEPEFIRRFETEAQLIARLEHIHIVPLYDYWREPGGAYLVMRWLKGGSVHQSLLRHGPWSAESTAQMLDQTASALTAAHHEGIVHQDIKTENILMDAESNIFLADFGIARDVQQPALPDESLFGTPIFMAPEQFVRGVQPTPQVDIYGLGIVIYMMLTGEAPFLDTGSVALLRKQKYVPLPSLKGVRSDLPQSLDAVLRRATAPQAVERFPDVASFAVAFRRVVAPQSASAVSLPVSFSTSEMRVVQPFTTENLSAQQQEHTAILEPVEPFKNPFKGLRAFDEADAEDFFGRDLLVDRLLARLQEPGDLSNFLAVVGPSGSGKSSVVKAGLLPKLQAGALEGSQDWFYVKMMPGHQPLDELASALTRVVRQLQVPIQGQLAASKDGLAEAIGQVLLEPEDKLLLLIDQFEEVFTLVEDEADRVYFLESLQAALAAWGDRLQVLVTLRADYYDRPLMYAEIGTLLQARTEVVLPLSVEGLTASITGPAQRVGLVVEADLLTALVQDVSGQPGALPLLQYTLTELFERRSDSALKYAAYREMGGIQGTLARRADDLYVSLPADQQLALVLLFLLLVSVADNGDVTRQRVGWSFLLARFDGDASRFQPLLDLYGKHRLLTFARDPETREPTVEIAHEALLDAWGRFAQWLDDNREDLLLQRRLTAAAGEWDHNDREAGFLASGARLAQFQAMLTRDTVVLSDLETIYVQSSSALQQRQRRLRQYAVLALVVLTVLSVAFALVALDRQQRATAAQQVAEHEAAVARSRELAALANANRDTLDLALLLGLLALDTEDTVEARDSLLTSLQAQPNTIALLHGHTEGIRSVAFSPDGTRMASGGGDGLLRLWDAATNDLLLPPLAGHAAPINQVRFSPDGALVATASRDGSIRLWSAVDGVLVDSAVREAAAWSLEFAADGGLLFAGYEDGVIIAWALGAANTLSDVGTLRIEAHDGIVYGLALSPGGRLLVSGGADNMIRLWDVATGAQIGADWSEHNNWVLSLAFGPTGEWLVSGGADNSVVFWDAATGQSLGQLPTGQQDWIRSVTVSADGHWLAAGSADGSIALVDLTDPQFAGRLLTGHRGAVWATAFAPDDRYLLAGDAADNLILRELQPLSPLGAWLVPAGDAVDGLAVGDAVAVISLLPEAGRSYLEFYDLLTGVRLNNAAVIPVEAPGMVSGSEAGITAAALSATGDRAALAMANQSVTLWETGQAAAAVGEAEPLQILVPGPDVTINGTLTSLAFDSSAQQIAAGSTDGVILVWDVGPDAGGPSAGGPDAQVQDPSQIMPEAHADQITALAFQEQGRYLASGSWDGMIQVWDTGDWSRSGALLSGHDDVIMALRFSPDGQRLVSASRDNTLRVWHTAGSGEFTLEYVLAEHTNWVLSAAFSPAGSMLASGSRDGTVILWDVVSGRPLGQPLIAHTDWVTRLAFSPDGQWLITGSRSGGLVRWSARLEDWRGLACQIANRNFGAAEQAQFFDEAPEQVVCPG